MTILVIVESPAKCKKIESYLGNGYTVIASYGHFRHIETLEDIDITNQFNTKYSNIKLKQIEKLRKEINKSSEIIIATDDDREGESIGWHICDYFNLSINIKRIIFHEITETAIKAAILSPITINMDIVRAQQARQILDLLVGFTISPILWNNISNTKLSAGRCQTPALRIIYENYLDIKQSPGKTVYNVFSLFTDLNILFDLNKYFENEIELMTFLELCKDWKFIYTITSPKKTIKKTPDPLTTSTLQQLASNELHLSPKETMKYAQQLYEGGYITYMRTDSKNYCNEFIETTKKYITNVYGEQYINKNIDLSKSVTQEAHESIRPVNIEIQCIELLEPEFHPKSIKLYKLIWKRALESCMPSAQYNTVNAKISAPLNTEFVYKTEQVVFLGWQIVVSLSSKKETKETNNYQYIHSLKQNVNIVPKHIETKSTMIELKSHYSEARLVQLLEEKGIGRPSTFASLVDKIQERNYVKKQDIQGKEIECIDYILKNNDIERVVSTKVFGNEKNKLVIQPLGIIVIEFLIKYFDTFFNYEYTQNMENNLDKIANNNYVWYELCKICYDELTNVLDGMKDLKRFSLKIDKDHELIIGKYGPVVKYVDDKKNIKFLSVKNNIDIDQLVTATQICLEDIVEPKNKSIGKYKGQDLYIKKGKYGLYAQWGKENKSLKGDFDINHIEYIDVIKYLDKDTILDPSKPVGFIRELNKNINIRTGKYGDYIFYKKPKSKKAEFYKLNGFKEDYKTCDKTVLLDWIKETHKIS
jgi:DNA topoisomerase-1